MKSFWYWIYNHLGDEWCGSVRPPGCNSELDFGKMDGDKPMYAARVLDDGFEVGMCYQHGDWLLILRAEDARRLAWFILWSWWGKATWFGLKRRIWYRALREMRPRLHNSERA